MHAVYMSGNRRAFGFLSAVEDSRMELPCCLSACCQFTELRAVSRAAASSVVHVIACTMPCTRRRVARVRQCDTRPRA